MYTIINMIDRTNAIPPDDEDNGAGSGQALQSSASLGDPNSTWDFSLDDPLQQIKLQNFMPVIVFDENAPAIGTIPTIPAMNFARNAILLNDGLGHAPSNW